MSYLDGNGLSTLWSKIKQYVDAKIVGDIPDNSITEIKLVTAVKNKLNAFTDTPVSTTTTISDVVIAESGYSVTGPNGNSIFFPAAGVRQNTYRYYDKSGACVQSGVAHQDRNWVGATARTIGCFLCPKG